jgi:prepilin-type processing-associated H-X9-DG protein
MGSQWGTPPLTQIFGNPRLSWNVYLYPYIEQNGIYNNFNFSLMGPQGMPWYGTANSLAVGAPTSIIVPTFVCPSDVGVKQINVSGGGTYMLGNYLAAFPGGTEGGSISATGTTTTALAPSFGARISQITDGTSNTMVLSEFVRSLGATNDWRGLVWADQSGDNHFFTAQTPNTTTNDVMFEGYCTNLPLQNRPCSSGSGSYNADNDNTTAARSMHSGGVNVLLCDGSTRFATNSISLATWQRLGTIAGGEPPGSDF